MAKEAERLLADSGWLPEPLRLAEVEPVTGPVAEADGETEALPDFLASDDEASADSEDDPAHLVAAE
jgi:ParB family chromosome partitioning protein